jgi:hypothetical protein
VRDKVDRIFQVNSGFIFLRMCLFFWDQ